MKRHNPLSDRLRRTTWRPVSPESRTTHLAAIESALQAETVPTRTALRMRRRMSVMAVAAALGILPAGIAVAAERSIPGDVLYPVKQVTETVRSWVDGDLVAEHRVEELEKLVAADAPADVITDQVDRATAEVDRLATDHGLRPRLAEVTDGLVTDHVIDDHAPGPDDIAGGGPVDKPATTTTTTVVKNVTTTVPPSDRQTTTTTKVPPDLATFRVVGYVHAGPTCPVERFPPDPDCADQPVPGAVLIIIDEDGSEFRRLESNGDGRFETRLPDGLYILAPQPYDGLLGSAPPQEFLVQSHSVELDVAYDTGIR